MEQGTAITIWIITFFLLGIGIGFFIKDLFNSINKNSVKYLDLYLPDKEVKYESNCYERTGEDN